MNIINEDIFVHCTCIMILLWPEGKLLARIVISLQYSELVSSLFVFFAVAIVLSSLSIKLLLIQLTIYIAHAQYSILLTAPPLFSLPFCPDLRGFGLKGSGLARFYCIMKAPRVLMPRWRCQSY